MVPASARAARNCERSLSLNRPSSSKPTPRVLGCLSLFFLGTGLGNTLLPRFEQHRRFATSQKACSITYRPGLPAGKAAPHNAP